MKVGKKIRQIVRFLCNYSYYHKTSKELNHFSNSLGLGCDECNININKELVEVLKKINGFSFLPNSGNLGDYLIAKGEYNFFRKHNILFEMFDDKRSVKNKTLVYGGGGMFTSFWDYSSVLKLFERKDVEKIIILPSSFYQCSDLIDILDERFTVFCREKSSYAYLKSVNTKADVKLAEDMALTVKLSENTEIQTIKKIGSWKLFKLDENLYQPYRQVYTQLSKVLNIPRESGIKIGYFMRKDSESAGVFIDYKNNLDLSLAAVGSCADEGMTSILTELFLSAINSVDIVISDRLHVCIGAALLGKSVIMVDNKYKKLSEVYAQSLQDFTGIKITTAENISQSLESVNIQNITSDAVALKKMNYSLIEFAFKYFNSRYSHHLKKILWSEPNV